MSVGEEVMKLADFQDEVMASETYNFILVRMVTML